MHASLAFAGAPHGTLVTASEQTAGRGRHGRRWSAPPASALLMSLLLRDPATATAATPRRGERVFRRVRPERAGPRIKWPNDIVVALPGPGHGLAKLAGILIEGRPQQAAGPCSGSG